MIIKTSTVMYLFTERGALGISISEKKGGKTVSVCILKSLLEFQGGQSFIKGDPVPPINEPLYTCLFPLLLLCSCCPIFSTFFTVHLHQC